MDGPTTRGSRPAGSRVTASGIPSVSVVVPTHHRPELLRRAVGSVLSQSYPGHVECIVVFDRQDPAPIDVDVAANRSLRLLRNDRTAGPAGAYNVGALASTGDYVAFCDDDDTWLPDKLRAQVSLLERNPSALCSIAGIYLGEDPEVGRTTKRIPERDAMSVDDLLATARSNVHSSSFIVRRHGMLHEMGLFDEAIPGSYGEDFEWLLRGARRAPVLAVRRPLVRVTWKHSYFAGQWPLIVQAIHFHLEHSEELRDRPRAKARLCGRLAFAYAATGDGHSARRWARTALRLDWRQARAVLAYAVSLGVVRPETVARAAHAIGRGV